MLDDGLKQQLFESLSETVNELERLSPKTVEDIGVHQALLRAKKVLGKARTAGLSLHGENRHSIYWDVRYFLKDSKRELLTILGAFLALAAGMAWMLS